MTAPKRIQRRRTKGWRMPEGAKYVGRPTVYGNPWAKGDAAHLRPGSDWRAWVVAQYRRELEERGGTGELEFVKTEQIRERLAGKDLACWCPLDSACHADVLLEVANGREAMTGQWEKYVGPAAKAQEQFWAPLRGHTDYPDEIDFGLARAVLAVVGPLIAEDTRVRMVEAAGRALERETPSLYYCPISGEIEQQPGGGFDVCCEASLCHEPISPAAVAAAKRVPS
jgi:hypothetical protein